MSFGVAGRHAQVMVAGEAGSEAAGSVPSVLQKQLQEASCSAQHNKHRHAHNKMCAAAGH